MTVREHLEADQKVRNRRRKREAKAYQQTLTDRLAAAKAAAGARCAECGMDRAEVLRSSEANGCALPPICCETLDSIFEPDPQHDAGLPFTRADQMQCEAIADYWEGEIKGDA